MIYKEIPMHSKWINSLALACTLLPALSAPAAAATPLDDALKVLEAGSSPKAVEVLTQIANDGNPQAQLRLGELYFHGKGVTEDENMAIFWWKKSAASGNAEAMYQIAHAYLFGNTAAKSVADPDREAATWYFKAASAGHAEAAYTLGLLFIAGHQLGHQFLEIVNFSIEDHDDAMVFIKQRLLSG